MKTLFSCVLYLLAYNTASAQFTLLSPKISTGVHGRGFFTDASLAIRLLDDMNSRGFIAISSKTVFLMAGLESNYLFRNDFRLVPKIGLEHNRQLLTLRLQNRLYPNKNLRFKQASWQICPEVGFNLFGVFSATYGYNFAITNIDFIPKLGHQLTLSLNIPLE